MTDKVCTYTVRQTQYKYTSVYISPHLPATVANKYVDFVLHSDFVCYDSACGLDQPLRGPGRDWETLDVRKYCTRQFESGGDRSKVRDPGCLAHASASAVGRTKEYHRHSVGLSEALNK